MLVCSAATALLLLNARRRRHPPLTSVESPPSVDLPSIYANIRKQCDEKADGWPHAESVLAKCTLDASGAPHPPAFDDGHGPIGAYAMLQTPDNLDVLRWCRQAFETFVHDVKRVLEPGAQQGLLVAAVLQESKALRRNLAF